MAERASRKNGDEPAMTTMAEPLEALIRQQAYQLYLERGERPGGALEDWIQAEREACAR